MAESVAFVDTNVLIYSVDTDDAKRRVALGALAAQPVVVLSAQVVAEFVNVCIRRKLLPLDGVRGLVGRYLDAYRFVPTDATVVQRGLALHARYGFQWWDALIVAAAVETGCPVLYSEDMQHGQEIEGTRIVNPFHPDA